MSSYENAGFTIKWQIENFSMLPHQKGEVLKSPNFVVDAWKDVDWHLELYPRGDDDEDSEGFISLYFRKVPSDVELKVSYSLTLEATDPSSEISSKGEKIAVTAGLGKKQCISLKDLDAKRNLYAPQDIIMIRFHVRLPKESSTESTVNSELGSSSDVLWRQIILRSGIQLQERSILWSVKSVSTQKDRIDKYLSEVFKNVLDLKVSLVFTNAMNSVCVPIEIQQAGLTSLVKKPDRLFVKCKITIICDEEEYEESKESIHLFESDPDEIWHFPLFIKTKYLTRDYYLNANGALNLRFDFTFSSKDAVYHWDANSIHSSKNKPQVSEWCSNLQSMLTSADISDVTLKAGDKTYKSYRVVLAAHSTVFRAMFENDMKEKSSGEVEIDDVEPSAVERMLTFLHSGVLEEDLSTDDAADLYRAADKYNIGPLKQRCLSSLVSTLSLESVCDVLDLANEFSDDLLWDAACNFVRSHAAETLDSENWIDLMNDDPDLALKVTYLMLTNKKSPCK